jgi:hypothetical protein
MSFATDHALATIASILGPPGSARENTGPAQPEAPAIDSQAGTGVITPTPKATIEPTGYCKTGPGPMAALRFKWTVRHGDDGYYVDETVGAGSVPVVNGPMGGEAAIQFVDDRAREAQAHFQALKNEMTGHGPAGPILASGSAGK